MAKELMSVRYMDVKNSISLTNYADTVVYDQSGGKKTLCAIRFGGYPEQVEAMASAICGGGSIMIEIDSKFVDFNTLAKKYQKKVSHDAVYAEATLVAMDDYQQAEAKKNENEERGDETEELERAEIIDLPPRKNYIYARPGDSTALFNMLDTKTAVPMIPEFEDYILSELQNRGILVPLNVLSTSLKLDAWMLKCSNGDENIISVVNDGLQNGGIQIPGSGKSNHSASLDGVNSVTEYLTKYGKAIAERIKGLFVPLFDPEKDTLSQEVLEINSIIEHNAGYSLYDAQLAVAEAIKRQLERHKVGLIIAECGSGKTKIGLTAIAAVTTALRSDQHRRKSGKTFNVVLCPSHVAKKWVREIEETLPNTFAGIAGSITELDRMYDIFAKGEKSCYAIITKEKARDGYMRAPAVAWSKRQKAFVCPDCGGIVEMDISRDGSKYTVDADQFFFKQENRDNHKCVYCGSPLWTTMNPSIADTSQWVKIGGYGFVFRKLAHEHLSKVKNAAVEEQLYEIFDGTFHSNRAPRRFALSTYIKKRYRGRIDGLIVDELHQYNNNSGQGDAMAELYGSAQKVIGMTATLINGYSSGIFYLLYRIASGLMKKDGKEYKKPNDFISEYGVIETIHEVNEADYSSNRRTVKGKTRTRQLPGVSPLVYSRFLLENAAFLSLTDMGKELPEYEEIPIPLELPQRIKGVCDSMQEKLRRVLKQDKKAAQRILSAYLNLLTAYPDQPYGQPPIIHPLDGYPIVEPPNMGSIDTVMPKDEKALEIVRRKIDAGEKVLIYVNWTRLDSQQKLLKLLMDAGYRTEILPAKVPPMKREQWVADRLDNGVQVLITNPILVETGLDLNAFTTLIFYDTGYKLFTLSQASRRSWRINQLAPRVEVYMLYYADTMQHKAIKLMGTKLAVAAIIEGGFSDEGLAAMSQCEDMTTLMAKELMLGIKDSVEDVSASFKRMAFLKPKEQPDNLVAFSEAPVVVEQKSRIKVESIEFTFVPSANEPKIIGMPVALSAVGKNGRDAASDGQISLFDFTA